MMNFNNEQQEVKKRARKIARRVVAKRAADIDESETYPEDIFAAFKDAKLLGIAIPRMYGGCGEGMLALALACEEIAKYCCTSGLILALSALPTRPILLHGTEEQKQKWLPPIARGEKRAAFLLTEPAAGSDASAIETVAIKNDNQYVINGEKTYASAVFDFCVVFAKTAPAAGSKGISAFIVEKDLPGFSITKYDRKMGVRGMPTAHFKLHNVKVSKDNLIGGVEGQGFNSAMLTLNIMRPIVGARGLGLAEGAIAYALQYARQRKAFNKKLLDLQAIQFMFADMAIAIESARQIVYKAAELVDMGRFTREEAAYLSIAKTVATEMAVKVASDALQILGAQGYMKDHPLERHYRDARQLMIVEGTSQIQRVVIAKALAEGNLAYA